MGSVSVSSCRCCMFVSCVLCALCGSYQCCVLHYLQFVNAGRGCKRRPYERGILQSFVGSPECLLLSMSSFAGECIYYL